MMNYEVFWTLPGQSCERLQIILAKIGARLNDLEQHATLHSVIKTGDTVTSGSQEKAMSLI